ncbi:MAG: PD40 domain-containing protein [Bacteroidota bacterium]|nr:MAG: PD40 domain-containing protein [Bacteroidota bacterium]
MRGFLLFATILVIFSSLRAQETSSPEELFDDAQYFFNRKDYKEAVFFFKKLLEVKPNNANFNFKAGECYLNIPGQEHLAVPYFEKACLHTVPKNQYKDRDYNESKAPLHAYYYLGNAYRMAEQLESALKAYNKFIDSPYFYGNYNLAVVEQEIKSCERAKIIQDSPIDMVRTQMGEPISSSSSEFNPVISFDNQTFVFVRGLKFYDAVFVSRLVDNQWSEPVNINPEIGSDGEYYPTGINSNGTMILFVQVNTDNSDIFFSQFDGQTWSKLQKLPGKVNSIANESFASFGADDKTIYLVSNRNGGRGGKDIWISSLSESGEWSKPKNLGKTVNTKLEEESPVYCHETGALFFSSQGHYNMGGFDIFYSHKKNNQWSIPRNVGYPLNTTRDNLNFIVNGKCNTGYYSIIDQESGVSDIFLIELKSTLSIPGLYP